MPLDRNTKKEMTNSMSYKKLTSFLLAERELRMSSPGGLKVYISATLFMVSLSSQFVNLVKMKGSCTTRSVSKRRSLEL